MKNYSAYLHLAVFGGVLMIVISCGAIAGGGFTQHFYGPTKIIKGSGNQLPETEQKGFEQHFYGETTSLNPKNAIAVDIKSIPDWVLIKEVERRGLVLPVNHSIRQYKFFNCCIENELCY